MTKTLADSNILVYTLEKKERWKHEISTEHIARLIKANELVLSIQNLVELSRVLSEKISPPLDEEIIRQHILELEKSATVVQYTAHTVMDALLIAKQHKIHFFDALLAATMQENGFARILTENVRDFKKIPWLEVINPFENPATELDDPV